MLLTLAAVLITALAPVAPAPSNADTMPLLGMRYSTAVKTDFFTFFHLAESARSVDSTGRTFISLAPTGDFKTKVAFHVVLDTMGVITRVDLDLDREFINGNSWLFARDITKSLLRVAPPVDDRPGMAELAEIIWLDRRNDFLTAGGALLSRDDRRVVGYEAFLGRRSQYAEVMSDAVVSFDNITVDQIPTLRITLALTN